MNDPVAPWMLTAGGLAVDLMTPTPEQITLADIATALSRIPRFNGHTLDAPYSVAEHCLLVADLVSLAVPDAPPALLLGALLHDAHEAYCGDRISPLKAAIRSVRTQARDYSEDPFSAITRRLDVAIHAAFALTVSDTDREVIHHADLQALGIEAAQLLLPPPRPWVELPPAPEGFVFTRPRLSATHRPDQALRILYIDRAMAYIGRRHGVIPGSVTLTYASPPRQSPDAADRPAPGDDSARHPGSGPAHEALPRATPPSGDTAC